MLLVVETNILYSFFWKNSPTHKILSSAEVELFAPKFALTELDKHKEGILFNSKIKGSEFSELKRLLSMLVEFADISEYSGFIEEAKSLFPEHLKDVDFFALALKLNCSLWSKEKLHAKQSKVKVYSTSELLKELGL